MAAGGVPSASPRAFAWPAFQTAHPRAAAGAVDRLEQRTPDRAKAVVDAAFDRGLLLLSCGLYGNVIRLLPPLTITDEELDEGLGLLDEALAAGLAG